MVFRQNKKDKFLSLAYLFVNNWFYLVYLNGDEEVRTLDLRIANATLCQTELRPQTSQSLAGKSEPDISDAKA